MKIPLQVRSFPFPLFVVFIAMMALASCAKSVPRETEPNGDAMKAMEIRSGVAVEGFLGSYNDVDFYKIRVAEPSVIDVRLSAVRGINHSLKLWNGSSPEPLKFIDDARKSSPERMCNLSLSGGYLYISVQHGEKDPRIANTENHYLLNVDVRGRKGNEEMEPNDNPDTATETLLGGEVTGFFSPAYNRMSRDRENPLREEDFFRFEVLLPGGKPLLLDLDLTPVPDVDSEVQLFAPGMNKVLTANAQGTGAGESARGIGITVSGTWFVKVTARNYAANCDIPYILSLATREYDYSQEMEPNNDFPAAGIIQGEEIRGRISSPGDRDFFLVKSDGTVRVTRIEAVPGGDLDVAFNVYDAERDRLFEVNRGIGGEREILPNAGSRGDLYVEVLSRGGLPAGGADYTLAVSSRVRMPGFELEPNDSKKQATAVSGDVITGYTTKRDDVDYYLLESRGRVKKRFTVNAVKGSTLKVSVTDPLGYAVRTVKVMGGTEKSFYEMIDQKGYLIVKSLEESYLEPYMIRMRNE